MTLAPVTFDGVARVLFGLSVAASAAPPAFLYNDITRPYIGTSVAVMIGAAIGAVSAFAYWGEPSRTRMFTMATVNMCLGAALTVLLPLWLGWGWMRPEIKHIAEPPLAMILAFAARWMVPLCIEYGPRWIRSWADRKFGTAPRDGDKP